MIIDPFWPNLQRNFLVGLFILVANSAADGRSAFSEIRNILNDEDVIRNLAVRLDNSNAAKKEGNPAKIIDPEAFSEIASFLNQPENTRMGILAGVNQHFGAFGNSRVQRASDSTSFKFGKWVRGEPMTVYVVGSPPGMTALDTLYRVWLGSLQLPLLQRAINLDQPAMVVLDINEAFEMWPGLHTVITQRHDCQVWIVVSDLADLDWAFDEFSASILNSVTVIQAFRPKNLSAARSTSELLGMTPAQVMETPPEQLLAMIDGAPPVRLIRMNQK